MYICKLRGSLLLGWALELSCVHYLQKRHRVVIIQSVTIFALLHTCPTFLLLMPPWTEIYTLTVCMRMHIANWWAVPRNTVHYHASFSLSGEAVIGTILFMLPHQRTNVDRYIPKTTTVTLATHAHWGLIICTIEKMYYTSPNHTPLSPRPWSSHPHPWPDCCTPQWDSAPAESSLQTTPPHTWVTTQPVDATCTCIIAVYHQHSYGRFT